CQIGDPGYGRNSLHQFLDPLPQKRLAASQTDLLDSSAHRKANDPLDFLEAEQVVFGHPLLNNGSRIWQVRPVAAIKILCRLGFRQTVETAKIAAIRQADPQVAENTPVRVDEGARLRHLAGAELVRLAGGGITLTEPSAPTSTLRS